MRICGISEAEEGAIKRKAVENKSSTALMKRFSSGDRRLRASVSL